jgi:diaminohydroxyphosphoribosylaminopyrimidine deaminase/5-amino-6-(5-phosphoribosylamino)uracil reductase
MQQSDIDRWHMARALELAARGEGAVEPNPMVGCVVAHGAEVIGEGWHRHFGGPHAEIDALAMAGPRAIGATLYVTLEPCCHQGKTPPCTRAVIAAGIRRVIAAQADPFPAVAGAGLAELRAAGIDVDVGLEEPAARRLNAPYRKLLSSGRPWVIAKWAMTLDGKIATRAGDSRWISGQQSRAMVHALRGRVDAVLIGSRTAAADDPLLTARPPGPRVAARIVFDSRASLASSSQLVGTASQAPVIVAVGPESTQDDRDRLAAAGCEVLALPGASAAERLLQLLDEMGRRRMTNVLAEGGGGLWGGLLDADQIDEVHAFVAPKLIGGEAAPSPIGGAGLERMPLALSLDGVTIRQVGDDAHIHGRVRRPGDGTSQP